MPRGGVSPCVLKTSLNTPPPSRGDSVTVNIIFVLPKNNEAKLYLCQQTGDVIFLLV